MNGNLIGKYIEFYKDEKGDATFEKIMSGELKFKKVKNEVINFGPTNVAHWLRFKIKFEEDVNPLCWVFDLLRTGSQSIQDPVDFGFDLLEGTQRNLSDLKKIIEQELFELSEAHYQRYFKVEKYFNV